MTEPSILAKVGRIAVKRICIKCGMEKIFDLDSASYYKWRQGAPIQNVFPDLSIDDRELLISGICGTCFDAMFGEPEEIAQDEPAF